MMDRLTACRICGVELGVAIYAAPAPALTSVTTQLDVRTEVHVCGVCGHGQSPNLPDLKTFYNTQYRISLESDNHDQLYAVVDGHSVFRTQKQVELVLDLCPLPEGARVLDFGAGKAATLRSLARCRPDLRPAVFDVSEDYRGAWDVWLSRDDQATHVLPAAWQGCFDLVTAHFVLEHVDDPIAGLSDMATMLRPGGVIFFSVPDPASNIGDLIVVDHVNHFTRASIAFACERAGLSVMRYDPASFRGAHLLVACKSRTPATDAARMPERIAEACTALTEAGRFWSQARDALAVPGDQRDPVAVYGAGFYGAFVATCLAERRPIELFLDRNPYLAPTFFGATVRRPDALPAEIDTVYAGLNPRIAREVLNPWRIAINRPDIHLVALDGSHF